jgi:hypothetical protein
MGEVFFGRSRAGRPVAVKLIYPVYANDVNFRQRFRLEVEAGRKVGGFHAAQVIDADPDAERPWMVTAFIAGPSLAQVLSEDQALPVDSVRVLGAGVAEALGAIHAAGLIHRDLKPSNILLAEDGPHVIDFGVARAIDTSAVTARSGTAGFMAPEVLLGRPLTSACDVFALGMVLAYAAGIRPFGVGPPEAIAYRVVHEEPDLSGLDSRIRDLVAACLAKEPSGRPTPATILELLADPDPDLPSEWLPPPVQTMIATYEPPPKPAAVAATDLARATRLLEEAEQIALALPLDEQAMAPQDRAAAIPGPPPPPGSSSARARGLDEEYDRALPLAVQRARALVHVAAVAARSDPAHAAQLLDDALHPSWPEGIPGTAGYQHILEALVWHCASAFGALLARIDPSAAKRLVADLEKIPPVIRARLHREFLDDVAPFIARVAEVVADVDIASAEELVWPMGTPARDMALAKVATVAAGTDSARAGQIAFTVTGRSQQTPGQDRREAPLPPLLLDDPDQAIYWKVRALTEIAIVVARAGSDRSVRLPDDAERFTRTIADQSTDQGTVLKAPSASAEAATAQTAQAEQLLTEAEQWARAISKSDVQSMALTSVKAAAAQIDPDHAGPLLTEAEQYARAISSAPAQLEALGEVALAAAGTNPAQAEQVIGSLPPNAPERAEVAMAAALTDPACGERIAASSADRYLQALVRAAVAVRTDPAKTGPLLEQAIEAAGQNPAHAAEIAVLAASTDPARAEQAASSITAGAGMTGGYWRARALAGVADVCFGSGAR